MSVEVKPDGKIVVRVPNLTPQPVIDRFVSSHEEWIEKTLKKLELKASRMPGPISVAEAEEMRIAAKRVLPERVRYYAGIMGLEVPPITITSARTRYGSCNSKNRISFSRFLMANDSDAIDYVVVHELSHIRHKDHSKAFWAEVASVLPDYKKRRKKLFMPALKES